MNDSYGVHLRNRQLQVWKFTDNIQWIYIIDFYCPEARLAIELDVVATISRTKNR